MKTITVAVTASGFVVVTGELGHMEKPGELLARTHSFNSLDKGIAHIRKCIKSWTPQTLEQ